MLASRYKYVIALFSIPALAALVLAFINRPPAFLESYYHLSPQGAHAVTVSLVFPFIIDLIFIAWAYLSVCRYTETIEGSAEWRAFKLLQWGLFALTLLTALFPLMSQAIIYLQTNNLPELAYFTRLTNYLALILGLTAGGLFYRASVHCLGLARVYDRGGRTTLTLSYLLFAAIYVFIVFRSGARLPGQSVSLYGLLFTGVFYVPDWLGCVTLVAPRLIIWYLFLLAVQNFYIFQMNTKGKFYRSVFQRFPQGLAMRVVSFGVIRILEYLPVVGGTASFIAQYTIVAVLLAVSVVGNLLIASGAAKLYKVEKV